MNCPDINRLLAEGKPLNKEARDHVATCPICQAMVDAEFVTGEACEIAKVDEYKRIVTADLVTVRPLGSDRQLTFLFVALFLCFAVSAAFPVGMAGLRALNFAQTALYYGVILVGALFGASALVQEMTPGRRRYVNPRVLVGLEILALLAIVAILFHNLNSAGFMMGRGCLRLGSECSLASAVLFTFILKDGFFVSPVRAGLIAGFFSGLAGVAVLAMNCSFFSVPHIWVWHFGVLPLSMAFGALVGMVIQKFSHARNFRNGAGERD
jgi:hypothetical protein